MKPVLTKEDFVRRYQLGEFGNRSPSWDTLEAFLRSNYVGLVHIRNRIAGGLTWYDVPSGAVAGKVKAIVEEGLVPLSLLYFSGMCPTPLTTLQGEVRRTEKGLDLFASRVAKPMRASLLEGGRQSYGLEALGLLKKFMDPVSYDWAQELLDTYVGHVVEFTCLSQPWGTIPRRNTLFWEVRSDRAFATRMGTTYYY